MQRCELFEFLLRVVQQWASKVYPPKEKISNHIQRFFDLYLKPFYDQSLILEQRKLIRENPWLNQLLYDNSKSLYAIYKRAGQAGALWKQVAAIGKPDFSKKGRKKKERTPLSFDIQCAYRLFEDLQHPEYNISKKKIEQCFQFA